MGVDMFACLKISEKSVSQCIYYTKALHRVLLRICWDWQQGPIRIEV
jgi:hypothetical protein